MLPIRHTPIPIPWTGGFGTVGFPNAPTLTAYVTGKFTVAIGISLGPGGTGTTIQGVNSTAEITLSSPINFTVNVPSGRRRFVPTSSRASVVRFPGSALWLNLSSCGSDGYVTAVANKIASYIGPDNDVLLERGNEHWNFAAGFYQWGQDGQETNLAAYPPSGTKLFGYYTCNGEPLSPGDNNSWYTIKAAHQFDVFETAWIAAGMNPARLKRVFGFSWGAAGSGTTQVITNMINACNIKADYMALAPYQGLSGTIRRSTVRSRRLDILASLMAIGQSTRSMISCGTSIFYNPVTRTTGQTTLTHCRAASSSLCYESGIDYPIPSLCRTTRG